MSTTSVTLALSASDQTAAAVQTARGRFVALRESIRSALISATKESDKFGASMSRWQRLGANIFLIRSIASGALAFARSLDAATAPIRRVFSEMHELTDRATEVGAKAADVRRLSAAFEELGVKHAGVEDVVRLMNYMQKATGDTGVDGLKRHLSAIAGITDATERAAELTRVFGKEGIRLGFLLRKGPDAFKDALDGMMAAMPGMSDGAIEAASQIDKGFAWIARDIKNSWTNLVAEMVQKWTGDLGPNVELGLALMWVDVKKWFNKVTTYVGAAFLDLWDGIIHPFDGIPSHNLDDAKALMPEIDAAAEEVKEELRRSFAAADILAGPKDELGDIADIGVAAAAKISDAWKGAGAILSGSYEAVKVQALRAFGAAGKAVTAARDSLRGSSVVSSASSASASSQDRNLSNILARLADLLTVQREGWTNVQGALDAVRTV